MIYCPMDTQWRKDQERHYAALLQRVDRERRLSLAELCARLVGMVLFFGVCGYVFASAFLGG